jgi:signal peptidase I
MIMNSPSASGSPSQPQETRFSPQPSGRIVKLIREIGETILIAGILFLAVNLVTARIRVEGSSMEPSLHDGEFVVINRLAYRWANPERGEIIVFNFPLDPERRFIKRIIGLPGDTISVHQGTVVVNNIPLEEPYIYAAPQYDGEWIVEDGHYFVLGDNRNNSSDSQNWGSLEAEAIIGKAVVIYWPLSDLGVIPHFDLVSAAPE